MYKRILVAVDGSATSNQALQEAIRLTKDQHAALRIVHVIDIVPLATDIEFTNIEEIQRALRQAGRAIIDHAQDTVKSSGIEVETQLIEIETPRQRVAGKIIEEARAWPADLLVIGTHGRRGLDHLLLGSVAESVVRSAPLPVLLIRGK
jgi:nucleotide-binding universal stress UspA family protein